MPNPHSLDNLSPEQLMALFQREQSPAVFDQLVARFLRPGLAVARQFLRNSAAAEDAVQETFLRIVRRHEQYSPAKPFTGWFYTILRNVCIDTARRESRHNQVLQDFAQERREPSTVGPSSAVDMDLLARLPEAERDVLSLRILDGLAFAEIGAALGISEEAAKKRSQRGLRRLRVKLSDRQALAAEDSSFRVPDETPQA
jgi:RNA polymerase sigma-70 factor (ECF subfamily)